MAQAAEQADKYEWMRAADLYKQALEALGPETDRLEAARITQLQSFVRLPTCYSCDGDQEPEFKRIQVCLFQENE